ncbi:MAG: FAD-dependent oxidoreductase [Candidatus Korarchaeota archaeon]|nr:FAD-dependent oxidoreductase [Candidatus Korarchaeota archaeon]
MKVVVVGFGLGGLGSAWHVAEQVPDAKITVIGDERPYVRHKLRLVTQGMDLWVSTRHLESKDVEIILDKVTKIRREQKEVVLSDGRTIPYDYLVLATGSNPTIPSRLKGGENCAVFRRLGDVQRLIDEKPNEVAIIGASFVALHVADAARAIGAKPKVIVRSRLIRRSLEPELSAKLEEFLAEKGVEFVHGKPKEVRDCKVIVDEDKEVSSEMTFVATGVSPEITLAKEAGLELLDGWVIKTDQQGRTSDPNIFAVGDNATVIDILTNKPIYMGIGTAASIMALNAAKALTGFKAAYRVPRFQKDVFFGGIHMASVGLTRVEAENEGFEADRVYLSGDGWGDHAYIVYEKNTKRVLGFSAISKEEVGWKGMEVMMAMIRRWPVSRLGVKVS